MTRRPTLACAMALATLPFSALVRSALVPAASVVSVVSVVSVASVVSVLCVERVVRAETAAVDSSSAASAEPKVGPRTESRRFVGIGEATPDPVEEAPAASLELASSTRGRVTWIGFDADLPLSSRFSIVPRLELVRVGAAAEGSQASWYPHLGGGLAYHPGTRARVAAIGWSGPTSQGLGSFGGELSGAMLVGGDPENEVPPPLELGLELGATRFRWTQGDGPAGDTLVQAWASLSFALHPVPALTLEPEMSLFAYDRAFDPGPDETRLGAVGALARVGSYAPRAAWSMRIAYRVGALVEPWLLGTRIAYAQDIGQATEVCAGVRFHLPGDRGSIGVGGGLLGNRVHGPLLDPQDDQRWLPVVLTEVSLTL